MKKRILIAAASLVLAALIILLVPKSPGGPDTGTLPGVSTPSGQQPSSQPTTQPEDPGVVRLYSCNADFLAVYRELAAEYTALTNVEVVVLAPDADGCQASLQRLMKSEEPPTVFCVHNQSQLNQWQNTLLDLEGTAFAGALANDGLGLRIDGKLLGIPMDVDGYGLLVNAEVLALKAAMTRNNDFGSFSALTIAVQVLKDNSVKAFPAAAPTMQDAWCLLTTEDLTGTRSLIDLYVANCNKEGDPMAQFAEGKSAFYLGGTWEYDALAAIPDSSLHVRDLDILPTYAAGAMQYICNSAWCVNASARQEDMDATLAFMAWLVTAGEGTAAPVDRLQTLAPFADAAWYGNELERKLRGYMETEAAVIQWDGSEVAADSLLTALTVYMQDRTDENWQQLLQTVEQIRTESGYPS